MVCLPEFKAGRAEVCTIDRVTDQGAGQEHFVRLPDGYLLACGSYKGADKRAEAIAGLVNVVMRWEGSWPPIGVMESVVERNLMDVFADRARRGQPYPDFSQEAALFTNGEL